MRPSKTNSWSEAHPNCIAWQLEPSFLLSEGMGLLESGKPVRIGTLGKEEHVWLQSKGIWSVRVTKSFDGGRTISPTSRPGQSEKSVQQVLQPKQGRHCLSLLWGPYCQVSRLILFHNTMLLMAKECVWKLLLVPLPWQDEHEQCKTLTHRAVLSLPSAHWTWMMWIIQSSCFYDHLLHNEMGGTFV